MRKKSAAIADKMILQDKLLRGVALVKREPLVIPTVSRELMTAAHASVLDGFTGGLGNVLDSVKAGDLIPDQLMGVSSKTVLAVLVLGLVIKLKKTKSA